MASELFVDKIYPGPNSGTSISIPSGYKLVGTDTGSVYAPGSVIQVTSVYDRAQSSYVMDDVGSTGTDYRIGRAGFDLTTLDISITPRSSSSKVLILTNINVSPTGAAYGVMRLKRGIGGATPAFNTTDLWMSTMNAVPGTFAHMGSYVATNKDNHLSTPTHFMWLDSPSTTSAVTYRFNYMLESDGGTTFYLNRVAFNNNDYGVTGTVSSVVLMEVAQ